MRTVLYKDEDTNLIFTFEEMKNLIINHFDMEIEPTDDVILNNYINPSLVQNGGCISLLNDFSDKLIKVINDSGDENEADRYLSQDERDDSVKDLYFLFETENDLKKVEKTLKEMLD